MKPSILSLFLFVVSFDGYSQITVTASTFPVAGDTLRYAVDDRPALDVQSLYTPPGGPQTWDLSRLQTRVLINQDYLPADVGNNFASFPEAELVLSNGLTETYFNVTPTRFEVLGYSGTDPFGFNLQNTFSLKPALPERVSPVNFFDITVFSSSILQGFAFSELPSVVMSYLPAGTTIDSIRIRSDINRINVIDAYGTVKLPFADYPVLRQKTTQYQGVRIDAKVAILGWLDVTDAIVLNSSSWGSILRVDTSVFHYFINDRNKETIALLRFNTEQNQILNVIFKAPPEATVPVSVIAPLTYALKVFPNPVQADLQLECVPLVSGSLRITLHNALGQVVKTDAVDIVRHQPLRWQLPTLQLPEGMYTLVLSSGDRLESIPVLVQH